MSEGIQFLDRAVDVSPEALSLDSILEVRFGLQRNYLDTEETLHHFREHLWCPALLDRSGWNGPETDAAVLRRMQDAIHELVGNYEKPAIDPDKLAQMRSVVERARRELLG